jgi:hypothetical protein
MYVGQCIYVCTVMKCNLMFSIYIDWPVSLRSRFINYQLSNVCTLQVDTSNYELLSWCTGLQV